MEQEEIASLPSEVSAYNIPYLMNTPENFKGGEIKHSVSEWQKLSSNIEITNIVLGKCLKFDSLPINPFMPTRSHGI